MRRMVLAAIDEALPGHYKGMGPDDFSGASSAMKCFSSNEQDKPKFASPKEYMCMKGV